MARLRRLPDGIVLCPGCTRRGIRSDRSLCSDCEHHGITPGTVAVDRDRDLAGCEREGISFTVPGRPVPKQRPRHHNGGWYTPTRTRVYERTVRDHARGVFERPLEGDVEVVALFVRGGRADLDNMAKAVLDALNGVAYHDDGQVARLVVERVDPAGLPERATVTVARRIAPPDPAPGPDGGAG